MNFNKISDLRSKYHSLDAHVRFDALEQLALEKTSDSIRELIHIFNECGWRETQFDVLNVVHHNPDSRCIQFLFQLSSQTKDILIAEKALLTLAKINSHEALVFLRNSYLFGAEVLKPASVLALTACFDGALVSKFLEDTELAFDKNNLKLVKNYILAFGELKCRKAHSLLISFSKNKKYQDLSLSALISLGKVSKNPTDFDELEPVFKSDAFEYQLFNQARTQSQFRKSWSLEDYLNKITSNLNFHPALLLEFNSFDKNDIESAFDLLVEASKKNNQLEIIALFLSKIDSSYVQILLTKVLKLIDEGYFSIESFDNFLKHLKLDNDFDSELWLNNHRINLFCKENILLYFEILSLDTKFELKFFTFIESDLFKNSKLEDKFEILNKFQIYLQNHKANEKKFIVLIKQIEKTFLSLDFKNIDYAARWIRLIAEVKISSHKISTFLIKIYHEKSNENLKSNTNLIDSIEYYFQLNDSNIFFENTLKIDYQNLYQGKTQTRNLEEKSILNHIKIINHCTEKNATDKSVLHYFQILTETKSEKVQNELLRWIKNFKVKSFKKFITSCLTLKNQTLQFSLVLALKEIADESDADLLWPYLVSHSQSLSGRALDALIHLEGNRAKRLVFDYLSDQYQKYEVVEKICRSFKMAENDSDFYHLTVDKILQNLRSLDKTSDVLILLQDFRQKLYENALSYKKNLKPTALDIVQIDLELTSVYPHYQQLDETVKSALRSAEIPLKHPEFFDQFVDKSSVVLGYSKAIDILLEKQLGRKILFQKLENKLFEFQNVIYAVKLQEDYPNLEVVLKLLKLESDFSGSQFPLHKASMISQSILSGKILNDQFKVLDGLRSWAVILLIFARNFDSQLKPLIPVFDESKDVVILAKKLIWLQDIRNPIAHRHTLIDFKDLNFIRSEVIGILKLIHKVFFAS